jgi:transcriptional regulator with XRE-family HTH domain
MPREGRTLEKLDEAGTQKWVQERMGMCGIKSLSELSELTGINKGTLSRYFRQTQRPTIDVVGSLCRALKVTPSELLVGLGAIAPQDYVLSVTDT